LGHFYDRAIIQQKSSQGLQIFKMIIGQHGFLFSFYKWWFDHLILKHLILSAIIRRKFALFYLYCISLMTSTVHWHYTLPVSPQPPFNEFCEPKFENQIMGWIIDNEMESKTKLRAINRRQHFSDRPIKSFDKIDRKNTWSLLPKCRRLSEALLVTAPTWIIRA